MLGQAYTITAMKIYFNMIQVDIYIFLSYTFQMEESYCLSWNIEWGLLFHVKSLSL